MPTFKIPISWEVCGFAEIEAETLKEAIEYAVKNEEELELDPKPTYIDSSFQIETDEEIVAAYNK